MNPQTIYTVRLSVGTFKPEVVHLALELSFSNVPAESQICPGDHFRHIS